MLEWKVIIIDRLTDPDVPRYQDMTAVLGVDMQKSEFHPTASNKPETSRMILSFPIDTPDLSIHTMMQVWAGWRDSDTGDWSMTPTPPFGGYIIAVSEYTFGGEKIMECELVDYSILLSSTVVLSWPIPDFDLAVEAGQGYPSGYTVFDWLVGLVSDGLPYDGVVRAHLGNGMRFDGVDPIFDAIFFNDDSLPGIPDVMAGSNTLIAQYGFVTLEDVVKSIADAALFSYNLNNYGGPDLVVSYWMSAATNGDQIVPKFNFRNVADQDAGYDWVVAVDADESIGEIPILHGFRHERDARDVQTRFVVRGVGFDETMDPALATSVYADFLNPEHAANYPTDYQLVPGWCRKVITDTRLHTITTAQQIAQYLESRLWGARGMLTFDLPQRLDVGNRILFRDPNEGDPRIYMVVDVTERGGSPFYTTKVGITQPGLDDVLRGGMVEVMMIEQDLAYKTDSLTSRTNIGQPKQIAIEMTPTHRDRNFIKPVFADTPALRIQGTNRARVTAASIITKGALTESLGLDAVTRGWTAMQTGFPHPWGLMAHFDTDGFVDANPPTDVRLTNVSSSGTGTLAYSVNGTTVTLPFDALFGDRIRVTATGVSSDDPLSATVWEELG